MKRYLFVLFCLFLNFQSYGENEIDELKNILYGAVKPNKVIPSSVVWEYINSKMKDYNYTILNFHTDSVVYFKYSRSYSNKLFSNKSYIGIEGKGNYEVNNNIIKICFEKLSTVQYNRNRNKKNELEEKNLEVELEIELYNGGMLVRQINGKKIFAEDNGNKIFDFKKRWIYDVEL
jgi:hypothetical protein